MNIPNIPELQSALAIIDQAASCASGNRLDHAKVIQAAKLLGEHLESLKPKPEEPKE